MKPHPLINKRSFKNCTFKVKGLIFILNVTSNLQVDQRIKYQWRVEEDYSNLLAIMELLLREVKRKRGQFKEIEEIGWSNWNLS